MSRNTVAAHQPNYLPWLGFFQKVQESDVFVLLDDVEFTNGGWTNRNRIKTPDGWTWLTVPVGSTSREIRRTEISGSADWREDHARSLEFNYGKAPYYGDLAPTFQRTYDREWERLLPLNTHLLTELTDCLGLDCEFVRSSAFDVDATDSERILELCRELDADRYFSGAGARSYMDDAAFDAAGIEVEYQSVDHPTYPQRFDGFVPELSVVDALFNCGPEETRALIRDL